MAGEEIEFVNDLLRSFSLAGLSIGEQRAAMEASAMDRLPGTSIEPVAIEGIAGEWVVAPDASGEGVVLSLHGGAYSVGSLLTNRWFSSLLSDATARKVLSIDYRLAPEHRFPAALEDALAAYDWLLATGIEASSIVLAGNSAGGGLALATLVALRDNGVPLPSAAAVVSPWTDLTASGDSVTQCVATDLMLDPAGLQESAEIYADPGEWKNPYVSPLFADLRGLPPILMQASRCELLRDDTTRFAERALAQGVAVTAHLYDDMPHVWHLFAGVLPEADEAITEIGHWLERH